MNDANPTDIDGPSETLDVQILSETLKQLDSTSDFPPDTVKNLKDLVESSSFRNADKIIDALRLSQDSANENS